MKIILKDVDAIIKVNYVSTVICFSVLRQTLPCMSGYVVLILAKSKQRFTRRRMVYKCTKCGAFWIALRSSVLR